jgi:hypothetical protein
MIRFAVSALLASVCACTGLIHDPPRLHRADAGTPVALPDAIEPLGDACPAQPAEPTRYLRQLSLDLRGAPPTADESTEAAHAGTVSDAVIDGMLESSAFLGQVREWHRALLWPNLANYDITTATIAAIELDPATGFARSPWTTFSPDPELLLHGADHPHIVVAYVGGASRDAYVRGGGVGMCDGNLRYPEPATSGSQPTYRTTGTDGMTRTYTYYDPRGVYLPYHDAAHCPNYCSRLTDAERAQAGYHPAMADFAPMSTDGAMSPVHELDPPGKGCPSTHPYRVVNACDNAPYAHSFAELFPVIGAFARRIEGYRMVPHFWSNGVAIPTCAIEAQDRAVSALDGASCLKRMMLDPSCGCGPDRAWCTPSIGRQSPYYSLSTSRIRSAINDEPMQIVADVVSRNADYFDIFRTQQGLANGPLALFYREQIPALTGLTEDSSGLRIYTAPASAEALPAVSFTDDSWHPYTRDSIQRGILTTTSYLARFPTWRARASHFRAAFVCEPFAPSAGPLPPPDDPCNREPNLAQRCGCQNCHSLLEPMAAYFGRFNERRVEYLPATTFPAFDQSCADCARRAAAGASCDHHCRDNYLVDRDDPTQAARLGYLRALQFTTTETRDRLEQGPAELVAAAETSGALQSCTVKTAWNRLMGRAMTDDEVQTVLPVLVSNFDASHHNYRALVRSIVTSAPYRRIDR